MNTDGKPRVEMVQMFAVPMALATDIIPAAVNEELAAWVLAERTRDPGVQRSNAGGWHSKSDLPARGVPALDQLFQAILEQVRGLQARVSTNAPAEEFRARVMMHAWATVMEAGHYVHIHDHADAHWSTVYYVDGGREEEGDVGGRIAWLNPIGPHRTLPGANLTPTTFELLPRTGLLVIFPGWVRHLVQLYRGARPRICIAANFDLKTS